MSCLIYSSCQYTCAYYMEYDQRVLSSPEYRCLVPIHLSRANQYWQLFLKHIGVQMNRRSPQYLYPFCKHRTGMNLVLKPNHKDSQYGEQNLVYLIASPPPTTIPLHQPNQWFQLNILVQKIYGFWSSVKQEIPDDEQALGDIHVLYCRKTPRQLNECFDPSSVSLCVHIHCRLSWQTMK